MNSDPLSIVLVSAIALYLGKRWLGDFRCRNRETIALPGAFPASLPLILAAIGGALVILFLETAGEYFLKTYTSQSDISWLFLAAMIAAGFLEELVFRGYLVIENKGRTVFLTGVVGVSILFALGHVQYWLQWGDSSPTGNLALNITAGSVWTLTILFTNSLWFYGVRFNRFNPNRSLLPCIAAHISSNIGVFLIKLAQGHVIGFI